jgi:hypothetical protein
MMMLIYYLPIVCFGVISLFELQNPNLNTKKWIPLVAFLLIIFAGFRNVGPDFSEYLNYFQLSYQPELLKKMGVEVGYVWLNRYVWLNNWPFQILLFFIAVLAIVPKIYFIRKYTTYIFPALLVYYSTVFVIKEMGQMRHGVAMGFALLAFGFMTEKKTNLALVMVSVAMLFHYSAICLFPAFFIAHKKISNPRILATILLLLPLILIDLKPLFNLIVNVLPIESARSKGEFYLNSPLFGVSVGIDSSIVLRILVLGIILFFRSEVKEKFPSIEVYLNLYFLGICYYLLFSSVSEFAQRTSVYFRSLEIVILPSFLLLGKTIGDRLIIGILIVLNAVYTIYKLIENPLGYEMFKGYENYLLNWLSNIFYY